MTDILFDTLLATGLLIGVVLIARRPVARLFGPRTAYALWLLPASRLVLPPIVLPACLTEWQVLLFADEARPAPFVGDSGSISAAPLADPAGEAMASGLDWLAGAAVAVWLCGALVFLAWRAHSYCAMRAALLHGAQPVGEVGNIRMVESEAVAAPVAFGVRDKVIAMPMGFMAEADREARDLAIAHEIAHHRGHDLLANILAQPLLALHWFNPIGWLGWRAMRRDQEAACDARVMQGEARAMRARYGEVIAQFAREQNLALAAPMAGFREIGPALGEKAIVHRLRSLTMTEKTSRCHRMGRILVAGTAMLALPLTATISFAEASRREAPTPPAAPSAPAPPVAMQTVPVPPSAPAAPPVPSAPPSPGHDAEGGNSHAIYDGDVRQIARASDHATTQREIEEQNARLEQDLPLMERDMGGLEREMARLGPQIERSVREALRNVPEIEESVSPDGKVHRIRMFRTDRDGTRRLVQEQTIDEGAIERGALSSAIAGIEGARQAISASHELRREDRAEALRELDTELRDLRRQLRDLGRSG